MTHEPFDVVTVIMELLERDVLTLSSRGIHIPARTGPLVALCGADGSFGSPEIATCRRCRALQLLDDWAHRDGRV
jgi:hypothetical protein